jgi:hypothetical protein
MPASAPGTSESLGPDTKATVQDTPPPVAEIPIQGEPPADLVFTNVLFALDQKAVLGGGKLRTLVGKSTETPLGRAAVSDVKLEGSRVTIEVSFKWIDGLGASSTFQPKISFVPWFGPRGLPLAGISFDVGKGSLQSMTFKLPVSHQTDPVTLRFRQFGILYSAPVMLKGMPQACA